MRTTRTPLVVVYMLWLVGESVWVVVDVALNMQASVQARVLLVLFQLLVYGSAAFLCGRWMYMRWSQQRSRATARTMLRERDATLHQQLQELMGASQAAYNAPAATAPPSTDTSSARVQVDPNATEKMPQGVAGTISWYISVQQALGSALGPASVSMPALRSQLAGDAGEAPCPAPRQAQPTVVQVAHRPVPAPAHHPLSIEAYTTSAPRGTPQGRQLQRILAAQRQARQVR